MTRMIAKAYRMADAIRAAGVPVVMGGPHVTEVPDEALGRDGGPRHADAVALGEADETWPQIVDGRRARRTQRHLRASRRDGQGTQTEPAAISRRSPGTTIDLDQFNLIPKFCATAAQTPGLGLGIRST